MSARIGCPALLGTLCLVLVSKSANVGMIPRRGRFGHLRKALTIVAAIAGYCLIEVILLLTSSWPSFSATPTAYQTVVILGQLILIPGLSALLSRIIYGPHRWGRRVLTTLGTILLGFILVVLLITGVITLDSVSPNSKVLPIGLFVLGMAGIPVGLFFIGRKARNLSVEIEAKRWLAEHQSGSGPSVRRWRNIGICWALWMPSLTVLTVLLFFPEISGIVSHVRHLEASRLPGYRIPIPVTWNVVNIWTNHEDGSSSVYGVAGRGIAFGVGSYLRGSPPLSGWGIRTEPYDQSKEPTNRRWTPKEDDVLGRRIVRIDSYTLTCVEYWPRYLVRPSHLEDSSLAFINCTSTGRLGADFAGEKVHVPAFYGMLEHITQRKVAR